MLTRTILILCALFAMFLVGCSKTETMSNENSSAGNSNKAMAGNPSTMPAPAGEKIGVPECDDFIAKYDACVSSKVPEAARAQLKANEQLWKDAWRKAAANPATKSTLAAG